MSLEDLISKNLLEEFNGASIDQIRKRFLKGKDYLDLARQNFNSGTLNDNQRSAVYDNIYDGIKFIADSFGYLKGYRAKGKHSHAVILQTVKFIFEKEGKLDDITKNILSRLDKMRKRRHIIDYDLNAPDITEQGIRDALATAADFADKADVFIKEKEGATLI